MDVQYYDVGRLNEEAEDALGARFRLFAEVLRGSDILSLRVPLTKVTRHLIGAAELALMKPSAILVNTCRGPVVDEAAMFTALGTGVIQGAGLDVFEQEPPASDNVILTTHMAGPTWRTASSASATHSTMFNGSSQEMCRSGSFPHCA